MRVASYCISILLVSIIIFSTPGCIQTGMAPTAMPQVSPNASMTVTPVPSTAVAPDKLYGLCFSPYKDGQDPDYGAMVNEAQLRERMGIIAPHTVWIRTYGSSGGLEHAGAIGHSMGLKVAAGAWLSKDIAANDREINALINESRIGNVDLAIVGSETLYREDLNESRLIDYIQRVRGAAPGIQVTTAETYGELKHHPNVVAACDVILFNYYPYWEGISIDDAMLAMDSVYGDLASLSKGKIVIVSETGWPSSGNMVGNAVPTPENSSRYYREFTGWARTNRVPYFYFDAFDEAWKVKNEGPQGAHWGIWDKDGNLKPGMAI